MAEVINWESWTLGWDDEIDTLTGHVEIFKEGCTELEPEEIEYLEEHCKGYVLYSDEENNLVAVDITASTNDFEVAAWIIDELDELSGPDVYNWYIVDPGVEMVY